MDTTSHSTGNLCDGCKKHYGYCINARLELMKLEGEYLVLSQSQIRNLIPIKSHPLSIGYLGSFSISNLQSAHDAFHQEDYETALLHYLAVTEINIQYSEAYLYVAVCHYMIGNIDDAIDYAIRSSYNYISNSKGVKDFIQHCENCIAEKHLCKKEEHSLVQQNN